MGVPAGQKCRKASSLANAGACTLDGNPRSHCGNVSVMSGTAPGQQEGQGAGGSAGPAPAAASCTLNVNVGVLGHVDSGKTSLGKRSTAGRPPPPLPLPPPLAAAAHPAQPAVPFPAVAALSTTLSTAALDKYPQSKERGITLDLGFSSFTVCRKLPLPPS